MSAPLQQLQLMMWLPQHATVRQLLCLLLWGCLSFCALLLARILMFYSPFGLPCFLALLSCGAGAVGGRVLLFILNMPDPILSSGSWRTWYKLGLLGAAFGGAVACSDAALRELDVPSVVLMQAAAPAVSFWLGVTLGGEQEVRMGPVLSALLAMLGVGFSLWPRRNLLSTHSGAVALQACAVLLEVLGWRLLAMQHPQRGAASASAAASDDVLQHASALAVLTDAAPAAVLALALPTLLLDGPIMRRQLFHWRVLMPVAAVAALTAAALQLVVLEPAVSHALAAQPAGTAARVLRDVLVLLVAAKVFNEALSGLQWLGYAVASIAGVALWCWGPTAAPAAPLGWPAVAAGTNVDKGGVLCGDAFVHISRADRCRDTYDKDAAAHLKPKGVQVV